MITTIKGTTSAGVQTAISEIRHNLGAGSGMVFTLLVVADAADVDEVRDACLEAGREHPSRIIIATDGSSRSDRMDAEIQIGQDVPGEVITLKFHGEVADHKSSALRPLLPFEIVYIDDHSRDDTLAVLQGLKATTLDAAHADAKKAMESLQAK